MLPEPMTEEKRDELLEQRAYHAKCAELGRIGRLDIFELRKISFDS